MCLIVKVEVKSPLPGFILSKLSVSTKSGFSMEILMLFFLLNREVKGRVMVTAEKETRFSFWMGKFVMSFISRPRGKKESLKSLNWTL